MVGIIAILVAGGILSWSSADNPCVRDRLGNYWFGPSCRFQCHCFDKRQCDSTTGSCSSLGCEGGYFGPGCQYISIAYKQPTTQSSNSPGSSSAVDGFMSTYTYARPTLNPTWSVELQHPAWIVWADVNVPEGYGTREIAMTARNKDTVMPCNATNAWITPTTLRIACKNVVNATTIILVGTDAAESRLGLTEVNLYGGRNIALRGNTSQSSVFTVFNSSLAVDAGTSATFEDGSCTHTGVTSCPGTKDPNWVVRLGQDYQIYRVDVYNRNAAGERLKDFRMRLGKAGLSGLTQIYQDGSDAPPEVTSVQMPASRTADRLEVTLRGDCRILTLCEVQVFGDCLDYKYGLECNFTCRCRDRAEVCNKVDGSCMSGCADGFTGVDCKHECPEGRFGFTCTEACSSNCVDANCHHVDGTCKCVPGWMGDRCTIVCEQGTYGHECSNKCSTCKESICHPDNGTCIMGCQRGWAGTQCDTECPRGSYGQDCGMECSNNCVGNLCDPVNGMCKCRLGWKGDNCDRLDADALRSGINPVVSALVGSGITAVVAAVVLLAWRHRQRRQRAQEQVIYDDIIDDIHPGVHESQINQSESRGDYNVLDVTSRHPNQGLGQPYTALNTMTQPRDQKARDDYDVLDATSRDPDEGLERTYTELTTNTQYQNISTPERQSSL